MGIKRNVDIEQALDGEIESGDIWKEIQDETIFGSPSKCPFNAHQSKKEVHGMIDKMDPRAAVKESIQSLHYQVELALNDLGNSRGHIAFTENVEWQRKHGKGCLRNRYNSQAWFDYVRMKGCEKLKQNQRDRINNSRFIKLYVDFKGPWMVVRVRYEVNCKTDLEILDVSKVGQAGSANFRDIFFYFYIL